MSAYYAAILLTCLMFGMGLNLRIADFVRIFSLPKAVLVGLFGQLILLPLLGFALCYVLGLKGAIALGVMLLTLCPGGILSNLFTMMARGDLALSITMTSISSFVTVITLPIALHLSMPFFSDSIQTFSLPLAQTAIQIALMTVFPICIGMLTSHYKPELAKKSGKWVRLGCAVFLPLVLLSIFMQNDGAWFKHFAQVGMLTIFLNVLTIIMGYCLGKLVKLNSMQVRTLSIEVGAQNAMLGITIAISPFLLNNPEAAIVPSIYGVTMVALLWGYATAVNYFGRKALAK